jgi:hypothetical protein
MKQPMRELTGSPGRAQESSPGSSAKRDHPGYTCQNTSPYMSRYAGRRESFQDERSSI